MRRYAIGPRFRPWVICVWDNVLPFCCLSALLLTLFKVLPQALIPYCSSRWLSYRNDKGITVLLHPSVTALWEGSCPSPGVTARMHASVICILLLFYGITALKTSRNVYPAADAPDGCIMPLYTPECAYICIVLHYRITSNITNMH